MNYPIYTKITPGMGRGVFAARDIKSGERVELCPMIIMRRSDLTENSYLYRYTFGDSGEFISLALGCGSLYNHSPSPNVWHGKTNTPGEQEYVAKRDIAKDEELFIDYYWHKTVTDEQAARSFAKQQERGDEIYREFSKVWDGGDKS